MSVAIPKFRPALNVLTISPLFSALAAYSELGISLLGFYAAGAIFLNNFFGRTVLPLGAPFGWIVKGPLPANKPAA